MGALFGGLSALSIGISDLFGRRVVAAASATTAAAIMQLVAVFTSVATMAFIGSTFGWSDVIIGGFSGLGMGTGLACYYGGIARSSSTVVAPLVATLSAVIPYAFTLLTGAAHRRWPSWEQSWRSGVSSSSPSERKTSEMETTPIASAPGSGGEWLRGLGYGFGLTVIINATADSGAWPAVSQRLIAFSLLVVVARVTATPVIPPVGVRVSAVVAGIFAGLTTIAYLIGVQADAAPAVVTASMFPAASVAVGRIVYRDPVSRLQASGIAVVLLGVAGVVGG